MEPSYDLLIHYLAGVDPLAVASRFLEEWNGSVRPPLFVFGRSGPGIEPTANVLRDRLTFREDKEYVHLRLRTSRARKIVDSVEFQCANPAWWQLPDPLHVCCADFTHDKIDRREAGYSFDFLTRLLRTLASVGPAKPGCIKSYTVSHRMWDVHTGVLKRRGEGCCWPAPLYWITYWPAEVVAAAGGADRLERVGLLVADRLEDGGVIVATDDQPPKDHEVHIKKLMHFMRWLGIIDTGA